MIAALASTEVSVVQAALDELTNLGHKRLIKLVQAEEDEGDDDDDDDDEDRDDYDDEDGGGDDDDDDDEADEGDDEGGATIQARSRGLLPPIDSALDHHLPQLAARTLVRLFTVLFHSCRDNFPAAARIAEEIARRGDDASQLALVEAFIAAKAHPAAHRRTDDTVYDVLVDDVFPTLGAPALTRLLAWSGTDALLAPDRTEILRSNLASRA